METPKVARKRKSAPKTPRKLFDKPDDDVGPDDILDDGLPKAAKQTPPTKKGMSEVDFQGLVRNMALDARNYITEEVAFLRTAAIDYYKGRLPDIDEDDSEEDRSRAVITEVRDTILGMLPQLLRIIFGATSVVKYDPVAVDDPAQFELHTQYAKQATDYVQNVVLKVDNPDFFMTVYCWLQDGLRQKNGFVTWYWDKAEKPEYSDHTGLSEEEATALASDPDVEVLSKTTTVDEATGVPTYDLEIKRVQKRGKLRIQAVPCENVLVNRGSFDIGDTQLFGFTEEKVLGDFVALGFTEADLADCDEDPDDRNSIETQARQPHRATTTKTIEPPADKSQRKIHYAKLYVLADRDGDGIPELNRVITAGTKYKILEVERVDEIPFATFCPYPEGFSFFGDSAADLTMDIQRIESRIMRDVLDSLAQSVIPQTSVLEGAVNLDDVLNPDTSRVIRTRQIGAVQPHVIPFVGKEALPVLDLMKNMREARTGMSDASQGLDPKAMQSTDADAVHATLSMAQSRIEMVARVFAEMGYKRLFAGILRTICKNQDTPRTIALGGRLVQVNPKDWQANMTVDVTLPLGRGSTQEQISSLTAVATKQEQILQELGPNNPLVTIVQYRYTLARITELMGWRNVESFWQDPAKMDPNALQQMLQQMAQAKQQASAGPAGPDPQVEMAKIQSHEKIAMMKLQHDTEVKSLELKANMQLEVMKLHAQYSQAVDIEQLRAHANAASDHIDAATKIVVEKLKQHHEDGRHERMIEAQPKDNDSAGTN
jgi:hypothetical protein